MAIGISRGRREHENITPEVNPMNRIQGTLTAIGVAMLITLGVSCGGDPTPEPDVATSPPPASAPGVTTAPPVPSTGEATTAPPAPAPAPAPASATRAPRAGSIKEFAVGWPTRGADVIVVATISSVLAEKLLGPYGEDGTAPPADLETGSPFTDYLVQIESVLKADDVVAGADTLVLRMFGYLSRQGQGPAGGPIFAGLRNEMPKPGDHLLFFLGRNPDGTYGTGPWGLLNIDGATVAYSDGFRLAFEMAPAQFMDEIRDAVSRISSHKGTVASFSSSKLVLVVDGDELTFDITGAKIYREGGDLAQDAEVKIEAEDSPDGLVAIRVNVVKGSVEEDLRKKVEEAEAREALLAAFLAWNREDSEAFRSSFTDQGILGTVLSLPESIGDPPIGLLRVMYAEVSGDTVSVHVMFDLGVQRNSLEHSLVKTEEGWKIDGEERLSSKIEGGAATVEIRLDECSFESGSNTLATGNVALRVINVGQRARHLAFVNVPESLDTIQVIEGRIHEADVIEALAYVHDLQRFEETNVAFTAPLNSGRYALVCFRPHTGHEEGLLDAALGVVAELIVP